MFNYNPNSLANSRDNVLWSQFGEVLRVVDSSDVSIDYLINVLERPNYKAHFRLFVLNPDETIDYAIPEEDIIINSGSFTENYQNGQRKSVNINLINVDGKYTPNINTIWVHSKFRFDIGLEFDGNIYWFPRGIYILGNPSSTHQDSDKQVSLSLVDKFAILEGKAGTLEATYEIPVGSEIKQAISDILTLDNGAGCAIDLQPIIYDGAFEGKTMPYTLSKDAGSTLGEMLLEIGTILNAEVYYNSQGNLCFVNINETTLDIQKSVLWDYSENKRDYFGAIANYDFESCINEVHVVGDNVDNEIFYAVAKNNNPQSPLCIERVGRRIEYINDSDIYNSDLAKDRAEYELRKYSILKTGINIEVSFNPLLFVNNLLTIQDSHYGFDREKFLIQSITYNIGNDSKMSISCSSIVNFTDENIIASTAVEYYKRRIIEGDNLANKTLYFEYPDDVDDVILSYPYARIDEAGLYQTGAPYRSVYQGFTTRPISQINTTYMYYWLGGSNEVPIYRNDPINPDSNIKLSSIKLDSNGGEVVAVDNQQGSMYRNTFIEDEHIRPIRKGDILEGATLYFNFPDNIWKNFPEEGMYPIALEDNSMPLFVAANIPEGGISIVCICIDSEHELFGLDIYSYNPDDYSIDNLNYFRFSDETLNIGGVISDIYDSELAKYILVDERTLPDYSNTIRFSYLFDNQGDIEGGDISFEGDDNLEQLDDFISDTIGRENLLSATLSGTAKGEASELFIYCSNLVEAKFLGFDTSNMTSMNYMFGYCSSLTSLDLSSFNTSNVRYMYYMFAGCESLEYLDISGFDTSNVVYMDAMFAGCYSLTSLNLSSFDIHNVYDMEGMFEDCYSLESLDLSNFRTSRAESTADMFKNCENLTYLDISNLDTSRITDMSRMFDHCKSLTSLNLSNFNTSNVIYMNDMFYYCTHLTDLNVSSFDTSKVINMYEMFSNCQSLRSLNVDNFDTSNATNIAWMFEHCRSLETVNVDSFDITNVTNIYGIFHACYNITTIYCNNDWYKDELANSEIFTECSCLVGAIPYDSTKTNISYANPTTGYFTRI